MKTITISHNAKSIIDLLHQARIENLILRSPDGVEFILAEIDDFDREIALTRQNKELMELLDRRARQTKTIPLKKDPKGDGTNADGIISNMYCSYCFEGVCLSSLILPLMR
jgi:hypothetical protein